MGTIAQYLDAKYADGGPDGGRFEPVDDEVHASHLSDCQRKRAWKHRRPRKSEASPYFELGRVFEVMYGAALAHEHDPAITPEVLADHPPWEVVEMSTEVLQDVNVEIDAGGATVVGESDWVVMGEQRPGRLEKVVVDANGGRTALFADDEKREYDPAWVEKVVETKTKRDVDWVRKEGPDRKHVYQVYPYVHALDCDGEIAYMQRDDWDELVVPVDYDEDVWLDCLIRAREHARNQAGDGVPPTTPLDESECRWCDFSEECRERGGSRWE